MTEPMPLDIVLTAQELASLHCEANEMLAAAEAIAAALLAERRRTIEAAIAVAANWEPSDEEVAQYSHGSHYIAGLGDAADRIAAAIRAQLK